MALLLTLFVLVIVFGLLFWLLGMLPIDPKFKQVAQVILILFLVLYLLGVVFGGFPVARWPTP